MPILGFIPVQKAIFALMALEKIGFPVLLDPIAIVQDYLRNKNAQLVMQGCFVMVLV